VWASRAGADIVRHKEGGLLRRGVRRRAGGEGQGIDVVLVDTAGRLHNKSHLMEEVRKVGPVIGKEIPGPSRSAPRPRRDSRAQRPSRQAKTIRGVHRRDGLALTKLGRDGEGGVVPLLTREIAAPIRVHRASVKRRKTCAVRRQVLRRGAVLTCPPSEAAPPTFRD